MIVKATRDDAKKLFFDGIRAFADAEYNGIPIDVKYAEATDAELTKKIKEAEQSLAHLEEVRYWKKTFGGRFKFGSTQQLAHVLFDHGKIKPTVFTKGGKPAVDAKTLKNVSRQTKSNLIELLDKVAKLKHVKAKLNEIMREQVDGYLHPTFSLHTVITYRSSTSNINFQSQDAHNEENAKILRQVYRPHHSDYGIGEFDFKGIEVCVNACVNKDPNLISYVCDKTKDMHRDMAIKIYILKKLQISKPIRFSAKNAFVFPEFYGDYYENVAPNLWNNILDLNLNVDGVSLYDHLKVNEIKNLKQFTAHVKEIERYFWEEQFKVYSEWKKQNYFDYLEKGYFDTVTGFRCSGVMRYNETANYPIQGPAFHCLLWSFIQLNKALKKYKFKTKICGQIHDSIVFVYHKKELDNVMEINHEITSKLLPQHWKWIIVPLETEAEIAPIGKTWYDKKPYELKKKEVIE